jgi:hypothetical protein
MAERKRDFRSESVVPVSDPERLRYQPEPPAENLLHEEHEEDS